MILLGDRKALDHLSLSSSSARSSRPEHVQAACASALFPRLLTWGPGWSRPLGTLIQSSRKSRRQHVGFICNLVKAGSVGFVEDAVEHVDLFLVAKKAGAWRFINDARASNRHFLNPSAGPLLFEFQEVA